MSRLDGHHHPADDDEWYMGKDHFTSKRKGVFLRLLASLFFIHSRKAHRITI